MKQFFVLFLLILATSAFTLGQTAGTDSAAVQEVKARIAAYGKALMARDTAALENFWSDDYLFADANGLLLTKQQRLHNVKTGATQLSSINVQEDSMHVRMFGDVAVVNSHVMLEGRHSGKKTSGAYRSLHVWVKRDGRWWMVTNQITKIAKP